MFHYHNVGEKIKLWAKLSAFITFVPFLLISILLCEAISDPIGAFLITFLVIIFGYFFAWLSGMFIFGFGELIQQTQETKKAVTDLHKMLLAKMEQINRTISSQSKPNHAAPAADPTLQATTSYAVNIPPISESQPSSYQ